MDIVSSFVAIGLLAGTGCPGGKSIQVLKRDITRIEHWKILLAVVLLSAYLFSRYFMVKRGRRHAGINGWPASG